MPAMCDRYAGDFCNVFWSVFSGQQSFDAVGARPKMKAASRHRLKHIKPEPIGESWLRSSQSVSSGASVELGACIRNSDTLNEGFFASIP